jgi:hypothetical protein
MQKTPQKIEKVGRSLSHWCQEADLSRPFVYQLWSRGCGPHHVKIGGRTVVIEAPAAYYARLHTEQQSSPKT